MNKIFFIIFLFLISMSIASAREYKNVGGEDNEFLADTGLFNQGFSSWESYSSAVESFKTPLIADLDSSGDNEIIVLDDQNHFINVYRFNTSSGLKNIASLSTSCTSRYSNVEIFDYDDDNLDEILVACETEETIRVIEFDGSTLTLSTSLAFDSVAEHTDGSVIIGCREVDACVVSWIRHFDWDTGGTSMHIRAFNRTGISTGSSTLIETYSATADGVACYPMIRTMDYDSSTGVYFFSYVYQRDFSSSHDLRVFGYNPTDNQTVTKTFDLVIELNWNTAVAGDSCSADKYGNTITAPAVSDFWSTAGNELVIGFMKDNNEFIMRMYDSNNVTIQTFPLILEADGILVSNVIKTKAFDDTDFGDDFCVLGEDVAGAQLDLLCGSMRTGNLFKAEEYFWSIEEWNITTNFDYHHIMTHSADVVQGNNGYEIIGSHGIFELDYNFLGLSNDMDLIFQNPIGDASVLMIDYQNEGLADFLALTTSNLFYIDDGFTNSPAYMSSGDITVNPCIRNNVWKTNTSVQFQVKVNDINDDNVCSNVSIYHGTVNQKDSATQCGIEGTTFTHSFVANETAINSQIKVMGRDVENPNSTQIETYSVNVLDQGISFGECIETLDANPSPDSGAPLPANESTIAGNLSIRENNTFSQTMNEINNNTGLSSTIIWVIFMMLISYVLVSNVSHEHAMPILIITNFFMVIIGALFGFISTGIIFVIAIIGVIAVGLWISKKFVGNSAG